MIVFSYSKTEGAEFISHLDTLRHIQKTLTRACVQVSKTNGFTKRMVINMASPIGVGQQTTAEYCYVETDMDAEEFKRLFNEYSPKHIKCINAFNVSKKCNVAGIINGAKYVIKGINKFDVNEILDANTYTVVGKNGKEKDVRDKIHSLSFNENGDLVAVLTAGNETLRADFFAEKLAKEYGGEHISIFKTESYIDGQPVEEVLRRDYV